MSDSYGAGMGEAGRMNVDLSEAHHAALNARALAEGTTASEVLRSILDREFNLETDQPTIDAVLAGLAQEIALRARQLCQHDSDLDPWDGS